MGVSVTQQRRPPRTYMDSDLRRAGGGGFSVTQRRRPPRTYMDSDLRQGRVGGGVSVPQRRRFTGAHALAVKQSSVYPIRVDPAGPESTLPSPRRGPVLSATSLMACPVHHLAEAQREGLGRRCCRAAVCRPPPPLSRSRRRHRAGGEAV